MSTLHDSSTADGAFSPEDVAEHVASVPQWTADEDVSHITRTWKLESFGQAMAFAQLVADAAEELNHHPDILISYKTVTLTLSTHSVGGLTEKDFMLASHIDRLQLPNDSTDKAEPFLAG